MSSSSPALDALHSQLIHLSQVASDTFHRIPGSPIITRYIASSYQNDPFRSLLELILLAFAIRTIAQSRTRASSSGSNFVKLDDKEIDELVSEFNPAPLCEPLAPNETFDLSSVPTIIGENLPKPKVSSPALNGGKPKEVVNFASYNFADLAGDEKIKDAAVKVLRTYGVGSCSPPGFYGTIDVHMALESDIARFLGTEKCIIYAQGFATIPSVIPAFSKRGDLIIADKGVNFSIQKGIQISRSTVRWYDHNDMRSLESVLKATVSQYKRKRPLTRRFIITEGLFENDGQISNLKKLIELKRKYKFRLILDESLSVGTLGKRGRGLTELYDVPAQEVDMIVGSMANTMGSAGGFCAGSSEVVFHQRINGPSYVFSAALPAMLAVASSIAINKVLHNEDDVLGRLAENIRAVRSTLDGIECLSIPSDPTSPVIHLQVRSKSDRHPATSAEKYEKAAAKDHGSSSAASSKLLSVPAVLSPQQSKERAADPTHDLLFSEQLQLLKTIVEDALEHGVFLILHKKLPSIKAEVLEKGIGNRPSIRLSITAGLSRKESEKAANIVKSSAIKVLGKRRI
ncbi:unnamed protein product [Sympodiomycopsis kandeliae]